MFCYWSCFSPTRTTPLTMTSRLKQFVLDRKHLKRDLYLPDSYDYDCTACDRANDEDFGSTTSSNVP